MSRLQMAKLILSKKGFDTDNGRGPSPILADGRMVPLPIPEPRPEVNAATYGGLTHGTGSYWDLLTRLGYQFSPDAAAHLDPDLIRESRAREGDWRGMFGQVDQAESHLANEGVGPGSLFIFWGWFDQEGSATAFHRSKGFSSLFGYLEVERVIDVGANKVPLFGAYHPHFSQQYPRQRNRVYIARERLSWNPEKPGWGVFRYHRGLRLSIEGRGRSNWRLPGCFHPDEGCILTYNTKRNLWGKLGRETDLEIPARGQEFVCSLSPAIIEWAHALIDDTAIWSPNNGAGTRLSSRKGTVQPVQTLERASEPSSEDRAVKASSENESQNEISVLSPLKNEGQVSFGDRLLWHQLGLQLNGHRKLMLTEDEYVAAVLRHYPDAVVENVRRYRSYFNNRHKSMGFREESAMPVSVEFGREAQSKQ